MGEWDVWRELSVCLSPYTTLTSNPPLKCARAGSSLLLVTLDHQPSLTLPAKNGSTQTINIHTSCSAPLIEGAQWGSVQLVGYQDENKCGFDPPSMAPTPAPAPTVSPASTAQRHTFPPDTDICETCGKPKELTLKYTGNNVLDQNFQPSKHTITGDVEGAQCVSISISRFEPSPDSDFKVPVKVCKGQQITLAGKFAASTILDITSKDGRTQRVDFHTSCSAPLVQNAQWGSIQLVGYKGQNEIEGQDFCGFDAPSMAPTPAPAPTISPAPTLSRPTFPPDTDICETCGKPTKLTFEYTGDNVLDQNFQPGKHEITGSVKGAQIVSISFSEIVKDPIEVQPGDKFMLEGDFKSSLVLSITSGDGRNQVVDLHTSCSAPLVQGAQWESIQLVGYVGESVDCGFGFGI
eukprot:scaffold84_cov163-Amphora_coffeaeformis.AAC.22